MYTIKRVGILLAQWFRKGKEKLFRHYQGVPFNLHQLNTCHVSSVQSHQGDLNGPRKARLQERNKVCLPHVWESGTPYVFCQKMAYKTTYC